MKIIKLRNIFINLEGYDEELAKRILEGIDSERKQKLEESKLKHKQKLEHAELMYKPAVELADIRLQRKRILESMEMVSGLIPKNVPPTNK